MAQYANSYIFLRVCLIYVMLPLFSARQNWPMINYCVNMLLYKINDIFSSICFHQLVADLLVSKFNSISMQNQAMYLSSHHS